MRLDEIEQYFEELKTVSKEKVENDDQGFLTIEKYNCTLNNKKVIQREKILKNDQDGNAAIIFPITENNEVILAIEPRVFTNLTVDIGLPAGYIEEEEEPEYAAIRELEEETGYTSSELIHLGSYYQDQGCSAAYNHYYLARNCRKVKEQNLDDGEFIKYILVTIDELETLIESNYIKGLNSAYAIEKGKTYLKER